MKKLKVGQVFGSEGRRKWSSASDRATQKGRSMAAGGWGGRRRTRWVLMVVAVLLQAPGWIEQGVEGCSDIERQALLDLKAVVPKAYVDLFSSWQLESDCCVDKWPFITCSLSNSVIGLKLPTRFSSPFGLGIPEIPPSLGNLSSLESLSLVGNWISRVPDSLLNLPNLTFVNLARNQIRQFPQVFLEMSQLKKLDLSNNKFANMPVPSVSCLLETLLLRSNYIGTIPTSFGGWTELLDLDLSRNFITWIPDSVTQLPKLRNLILDYNALQTLPFSVGRMTQLIKLTVSCNNISALPTSAGGLASLRYLNLRDNGLSKFPEMLLNLSDLITLDVSQNAIDSLPDSSWETLAPSLDVLVLSWNLIQTLPDGFASLMLKDLYLDHNLIKDFPPALPYVLRQLDLSSNRMGDSSLYGRKYSGFEYLNLANNQFTRIPYNLVEMEPYLESLDLSGNLITQFEHNFAFLNSTRFQELILSDNNLQGRIPESWINLADGETTLTGLDTISLDNNVGLTVQVLDDIAKFLPHVRRITFAGSNLTGEIPQSLSSLTKLEVLYLGNNMLGGAIPAFFDVSFPQLRELNLSRNSLTGSIPNIPFNTSISSTTVLDLSYNSLSGSLPTSIAEVTLLSHNNLTGEVPWGWSSIPVKALDLSYNGLGGNIPSFLGSLGSLRYLNLASNSFGGQLPVELGNCSALEHLLLTENLLDGQIPSSFGQNFGRTLKTLSLSNNRLSGPIPDSIGNCSMLRVLDLSRNYLNGTLPSFLDVDALTNSLVVLTVGHNSLSGEVPWWITRLKSLQVLDLSYNNFWGYIPTDLSNLAALNFPNPTSTTLSPNTLYEISTIKNGNSDAGTLFLSHRIATTTSIDLTSNHLKGDLPLEVGDLTGLVFLSVSKNDLNGILPPSLGNLTQLQSLDLSSNSFSGSIPRELSDLTLLTFFNVSNNNLSGQLPQGAQFSSLPSTSFLNNPGLCGNPLPACVAPMPALAPPLLGGGKCDGWGCHKILLLCLAIGAFIFFVLSLGSIIFFALRRNAPVVIFDSGDFEQKLMITAKELEAATGDEQNIIGRGSASTVYRVEVQEGKVTVVAVKKMEMGHDERHDKKGQNRIIREMEGLGSLRHRNLVRVMGVCYSGYHKSLILEYVSNGSLHDHMHEVENGKCEMPLEARLKICTGVADALAFLHGEYDTPILHLDIKPSNILLDDDFNPKVTDFSIAKFVNPKCNADYGESTALSVVGTPGYVAPEYGSLSRVSAQGDVYSFGMVLLELFTGKAPTDSSFSEEKTLRKWVMDACTSPDHDDILDVIDHFLLNQGKNCSKEHQPPRDASPPSGTNNSPPNLNAFPTSGQPSPTAKRVRFGEENQMKQVQLVLGVALLCTHEDPEERPTMEQVRDRLHHIRENHAVERAWPEIIHFTKAKTNVVTFHGHTDSLDSDF